MIHHHYEKPGCLCVIVQVMCQVRSSKVRSYDSHAVVKLKECRSAAITVNFLHAIEKKVVDDSYDFLGYIKKNEE